MAQPPQMKRGSKSSTGFMISVANSGILQESLQIPPRLYDMLRLFTEGYGDNEELIGKWFSRTGKRDDVDFQQLLCGICLLISKVFLATKFAVKMGPDGSRVFCNDPEYIRAAIDISLKRLQTDRVDLWYW